MLLSLAQSRRVLFLGGKGGVGKTTIASAVALDAARSGRRVLVVSTDPAHNLGHLWERRIGDRVTPLADGAGGGAVHGIEIDPDATTDQHLRDVATTLKRLMPRTLHGEVDKHMDLSRRSPGTHEAAVLERMTELVERGREEFDLVVLDTAPSGHTARLMALPEEMTAWTDGLLARREKSARLGAARRGLERRGPGRRGEGDLGASVLGSTAPRDPLEERDEQVIEGVLRQRGLASKVGAHDVDDAKSRPDTGDREGGARSEEEDAVMFRLETEDGQGPPEDGGDHEQPERPLEVDDGLLVEGHAPCGPPRQPRSERRDDPLRDHTEDDEEQDPQPLPDLQEKEGLAERVGHSIADLPGHSLKERHGIEHIADEWLVLQRGVPGRDLLQGLLGEDPPRALLDKHELDLQVRSRWRVPGPGPRPAREDGVSLHRELLRVDQLSPVQDGVEVLGELRRILAPGVLAKGRDRAISRSDTGFWK